MNEYYLSTRDLKGYCQGGFFSELKKTLDEHIANGWRHKDCLIVKTKARWVGFKIRACYFPDINAFFPPKKRKDEPRVEIFGWSILIEPVRHDFYYSIAYDPLGEFQPGTLCSDIEKASKAKK
jgi:hypothetical protein